MWHNYNPQPEPELEEPLELDEPILDEFDTELLKVKESTEFSHSRILLIHGIQTANVGFYLDFTGQPKAIAKCIHPKKVYSFIQGKQLKIKGVTWIKGVVSKTLPDFLFNHPKKCALVNEGLDILSLLYRHKRLKRTVLVFRYFGYNGWQDKAAKWHEIKDKYKYEYLGWTKSGQVAVLIG